MRGANGTVAASHLTDRLVLASVNHTASSGTGTEFFISGDFKAGTSYLWTLREGSTIKDRCGVETVFGSPSVDDNTEVHFAIKDLEFSGITPTDGTMAANPGSKIQLKFNQPMNPDALSGRCSVAMNTHCFAAGDCPLGETCEGIKFTLTPAIAKPVVKQDPSDPSQLDIYGQYQLGTQYVFTIPAGTSISECPGAETSDAANGCDLKDVKEITFSEEQSVAFRTASTISLTGAAPEDNTSGLGTHSDIRLTFNQEMDPSTLTQGATGFEISPHVAMEVHSGAMFRDLSLAPTDAAGFSPGTYTFTLHSDAQIKDFLGNTYVQPSDVVIHFSVQRPQPVPDCIH